MAPPKGHPLYCTSAQRARAQRDYAQADAIVLAAKALAGYVEQHAPRYELSRGQMLNCIANVAADELRALTTK